MKKTKTPLSLIFCAVISGLLMYLAFTIEYGGLLSFVALVPLLTGLLKYRDTNCGFIKTLFIYSFSYHLPTMLWLYSLYPLTFSGVDKFPSAVLLTLAVIVIALCEGLLFAIAFIPFNRLIKSRIPFTVSFIGLYIFGEFLQANAGELSFPWTRLGTLLAPFPNLVQSASLFGTMFVSAIILLINCLISLSCIYIIRKTSVKKALLCILTAALIFTANDVYGLLRINSREAKRTEKEKVSVAVIQANLGSKTKWDTPLHETVDTYINLSEEAEKESNPQTFLWPETAVPSNLSSGNIEKELAAFCDKTDSVLVTGFFTEQEENGEEKVYNSLGVITKDGQQGDIYHKRELVPMGEYVPFEKVLSKLIPYDFGGISAGTEPTILKIGDHKSGAVICYESIYPYITRESVKAGAEFFLMSSNDSWFGDTAALNQHLSHAVMRCIETGRDMARAGNTGISAVITSEGKIKDTIENDTADYIVSDLCVSKETTLYTVLSDIIVIPCAGILLYGLFLVIKNIISERKNKQKNPFKEGKEG